MNMEVRSTKNDREMLKESIRSRIMVGNGMSINPKINTTPAAELYRPYPESAARFESLSVS